MMDSEKITATPAYIAELEKEVLLIMKRAREQELSEQFGAHKIYGF